MDVRLLVAGGRQARPAGARDRRHHLLYDLAVAAILDTGPGTLEPFLEWRTPGCPDGVGHRFGAPSVRGDEIVLCTERDVLRVTRGEVHATSDPAYNDLHHAAVLRDGLYAVSTGVDGVIGPSGFLPALPVATRPDGDVRFATLRDRAHPNHVFEHGGRPWATRGSLGDVVPLDGGPPVRVAEVAIHDGLVRPEGTWFTGVDGRLVLVDLDAGTIRRTIRLDDVDLEPLGWCRGLWIEGDRAWVGFTRIRVTRLRRHLAWVRGRLRGRPVATRRPTRLVEVDLGSERVIRVVPTEDVGLDAVFGLAGMP